MTSTTRKRLALPTLVLAAALGLAACGGGGSDTASTGSPSGEHGGGHGGGHSTDSSAGESAEGNDADVSFLTGMTPHHEQAVEMSDIVLAAGPPAEVAAIAQKIKGAQAPEIQQMEQMLEALGEEPAAGEHGGGHSGGHGGMMSEQEMTALKAAKGPEAARLYLEGMIKHHQGAIEASEAEIADGRYRPAIDLAKQIKTAQQAEIAEMQALLTNL